jgi:hypothetical protein
MQRILLSVTVAAGSPLIAAQPRVGDKAIDFTLQSLRGTPVRLSELIAKSPVAWSY